MPLLAGRHEPKAVIVSPRLDSMAMVISPTIKKAYFLALLRATKEAKNQEDVMLAMSGFAGPTAENMTGWAREFYPAMTEPGAAPGRLLLGFLISRDMKVVSHSVAVASGGWMLHEELRRIFPRAGLPECTTSGASCFGGINPKEGEVLRRLGSGSELACALILLNTKGRNPDVVDIGADHVVKLPAGQLLQLGNSACVSVPLRHVKAAAENRSDDGEVFVHRLTFAVAFTLKRLVPQEDSMQLIFDRDKVALAERSPVAMNVYSGADQKTRRARNIVGRRVALTQALLVRREQRLVRVLDLLPLCRRDRAAARHFLRHDAVSHRPEGRDSRGFDRSAAPSVRCSRARTGAGVAPRSPAGRWLAQHLQTIRQVHCLQSLADRQVVRVHLRVRRQKCSADQ